MARFSGTDEADTILGSSVRESIFGQEGDDRLFGGEDFEDVAARLEQVGDDAVLSVGNNRLTLEDVSIRQLDGDDFIF
ncbi:MAG: hypothetical protein Kilf2KO_33210 [Rhodospirillales bacterium]